MGIRVGAPGGKTRRERTVLQEGGPRMGFRREQHFVIAAGPYEKWGGKKGLHGTVTVEKRNTGGLYGGKALDELGPTANQAGR